MRLITASFVALLVFLDFDFGLAVDTIAPGESVRDGDVLISNGERFAAGFFSPGNSSDRYLGIWYNKGSEKTIVWVANRDNSIRNKAGVVRIDGGNLVLYRENSNESIVVWSSNVSLVSTDSLAVQLQDSGNLVLFRTQDRSKVVWQSFDYPTNVMLPGLKLGLDRRTGLVRNISSWKSNDDPGKGNMSLGIDPTGSPQLILYKGRDPWWRAGPWMGQRWSGIPEMMATFMFDTTYVNDADELSISFGTSNSSFTYFMVSSEGASVQRVMGEGNEQQLVVAWSAPKDECDRFNNCGANGNCDLYNLNSLICRCLPGYEPRSLRDWNSGNGSGGCARTPGSLTCQSGEGFVKLANVKVPDTSMAQADMSLSLKACEEECLNNCSCTAFTSADYDKQIGCLRWFGHLYDTRTYSGIGQDIYIRVDAATLAQEKKKSKKFLTNKKILAIVVTPIAILIIVSIVYWLMKRRRSGLKDFENGESDGSRNLSLPVFGVSTIRAATNEFLPANKLGEGGFGSVYKGRLKNGDEIAVKRLSKTSRQGADEFKTEVRLISKLQHKNLVRIVGCCIHKEEKMLVYEFLPNKSLDRFIFDETRRSLLDWNRRYEIVLGIARGLLYLHHDSRLKIIHRDLKASNVLLDAAWNPKISDFGMARIFGEDQTEANTNKVVGTYGYMSPEYAMEGLYSMKSDVFSYGVIVLEIISGRKNHHYYEESPSKNLIGLVWELWNEENVMSIVDSSIQDSYDLQQVSRCIHIALLCVQECPAVRPSMSSIVFMLSNETALASPNKPAYVLKRGYNIDSSSSASTNNVTMTVMEAR